ncbi:hypothetical protein [Streptomyces glaucescens]|uniref:hypothetical protein n=1 Tax=Streptomyces glaucescens TaxID=1907 RepID=UPI000A37F068|nr:hypothetical protein [Streptomyces glaucescens]
MTTMATEPTPNPFANTDYYRGRADAYNEEKAGADVETLEDRYEWMTDPTTAHNTRQLLSTAYLQGYRALIDDIRAEQHWNRYLIGIEYAAWLEASR